MVAARARRTAGTGAPLEWRQMKAMRRYPRRICPLSNDASARTLGCRDMPGRRISVAPAEVLREGFEAIRREAQVPDAFTAEVEAEAQRAAARAGAGERVDLPFTTIDPPGSRDLDQAMHIERSGEGHR